MAAHLIPCPGCSRHVRAGELECPFCASALGDAHRAVARPRAPSARLGRAATFAFGAAVATSIQVTGCADSTEREADAAVATDAGGEDTDAGAADTDAGLEDDAGAVGPLYGGPTPFDAGPDAGGGTVPPYGAPPED